MKGALIEGKLLKPHVSIQAHRHLMQIILLRKKRPS